jgi:hypothetical protein
MDEGRPHAGPLLVPAPQHRSAPFSPTIIAVGKQVSRWKSVMPCQEPVLSWIGFADRREQPHTADRRDGNRKLRHHSHNRHHSHSHCVGIYPMVPLRLTQGWRECALTQRLSTVHKGQSGEPDTHPSKKRHHVVDRLHGIACARQCALCPFHVARYSYAHQQKYPAVTQFTDARNCQIEGALVGLLVRVILYAPRSDPDHGMSKVAHGGGQPGGMRDGRDVRTSATEADCDGGPSSGQPDVSSYNRRSILARPCDRPVSGRWRTWHA